MGIIDLPPDYAWLAKEPGPKMLVEALKLYGLHEGVGQADNPVILQWAQKLGLKAYQHDETAWCGLLMAWVAHLANKPIPENPLWARNWAKWGVESKRPCLGDVLVFSRLGGGGHVTLYVGEDATHYHCLGGNQSDKVCVTRIEKRRLLPAGARQFYATAKPQNCRPVYLSAVGVVSVNEA